MQQTQHSTEPAADFSDALLVIRDYHAHFLAPVFPRSRGGESQTGLLGDR